MRNMMNKIAKYIPLFVIAVFLTSCITDSFRNEVTVYPVLEDKEFGLIPLNRTVYKVFPESQTVIYWSPGIDEIPRELTKCVVRDRLHWQCEYSDRSAKLTMKDGDFKEIIEKKDHADSRYKYVSSWKWWMAYIWGALK
jgi:hypothetical protein